MNNWWVIFVILFLYEDLLLKILLSIQFFNSGGSIHSPYHSATCDVGTPIIKVFGVPLWQDPRSPRAVISPENFPGKCWPMKGSQGFIVVKVCSIGSRYM